jgi:hypothetical protein
MPAPPRPGPPSGIADLVRRTASLAPERSGTTRGEPGRIRVERVRSASGRVALVYAPGTQTWARGRGRNPMDATSNLDAMAGIPSAAQRGVVAALRRAGVGRDEPLLLVGYSQGGLTTMALAADPGFRAEFSPAAVLTVGAPVGGLDVAGDVAVLSIEHVEDLMTVADGAANPDRPGWTTVRRSLLDPVRGDPSARAVLDGDPWAAHDVDSYLATAGLVDRLDDVSVGGWLQRAAPFLDSPGATVTASDWVAERRVRTPE